jgi:hypothetical protein
MIPAEKYKKIDRSETRVTKGRRAGGGGTYSCQCKEQIYHAFIHVYSTDPLCCVHDCFFWHVTHGRLRTCLQWRRIGKRMCNLRWSVCNIVELVHAKITHTYAAARRLSGMPSGLCYLMFSEFQICLFWASFRGKGCRFPTKTCNSGRLHNLDWLNHIAGGSIS